MSGNQDQLSLLQRVALGCFSLLAITSYAGPGAWDSSFMPTVSGAVYASQRHHPHPGGPIELQRRPGRQFRPHQHPHRVGSGAGGAERQQGHHRRRLHQRELPSLLNADGTVDTAFSSYPNGAVNAIGVQSDGKIVIGGAFTTVTGASRSGKMWDTHFNKAGHTCHLTVLSPSHRLH